MKLNQLKNNIEKSHSLFISVLLQILKEWYRIVQEYVGFIFLSNILVVPLVMLGVGWSIM